jgi:hypothetical protein
MRDSLRTVRQQLNPTHSEQWIWLGGSVSWPAPFSDLNLPNLSLWGPVKALIFLAPTKWLTRYYSNEVENACLKIRKNPGILYSVCNSVRLRAEICVEMHANVTEHLVSGHALTDNYFCWAKRVRCLIESRGSAVGIATSCGLDNGVVGVLVPLR